jgi:hypothetical protein
MIHYFAILFIAVTLAVTTQAYGDSADKTEQLPKLPYALTADEVLKQIAQRGPGPVVWELYDQEAEWDRALGGISSGDRKWLKVAARLLTASDAGVSSELDTAINDAIEKAPELVLEMGYCGERLYESSLTSFAEAMDDMNRKIKALSKVKRRDLIKRRDDCIKSLRQFMTEVRKDYGITDKE